MAKVNKKEFAEKWARRMKGSTADIARGVDKVTEAPAQKAIAKQEKMKANLIKAIDDGRWAAGLEKVSLEQWKAFMKEKGINRISAGVDGAGKKMEDFGAWLLDRVETGQAKIESMPDISLEDNINRMVTYIRHMSEEKYKGKR